MVSINPTNHLSLPPAITKKKKEIITPGLAVALKAHAQNNDSNERSFVKRVYSISNERFAIQNNDYLPDLASYKNITTCPAAILIRPEIDTDNLFKKITASLRCPTALYNEIEQEKAQRFVDYFWDFVSDPVALLKHLQPIEEAITEKLKTRDQRIAFDPEKDAPAYLIAGKGHYIPGPPPERHTPKKKGHLIEEVLREKELALGINKQGTPIFTGAIAPFVADYLVASGNLFKEDVSISTLLLHGKNSHRLLFQALIESLKGTEFKDLNPTLILQLLVATKYKNPITNKDSNLWIILLDSVDTRKMETNLPYTSSYHYSCRSPFSFNSFLLCFGKELGLPNLMYAMLDSHWKSADKMVDRILALKETQSGSGSDAFADRSAAYITAMESLTLNTSGEGEIGANFPFTNTPVEASSNSKYQIHPIYSILPLSSGIKLKTTCLLKANN